MRPGDAQSRSECFSFSSVRRLVSALNQLFSYLWPKGSLVSVYCIGVILLYLCVLRALYAVYSVKFRALVLGDSKVDLSFPR